MLSTEPIITLNEESALDALDGYREFCEEWREFIFITLQDHDTWYPAWFV